MGPSLAKAEVFTRMAGGMIRGWLLFSHRFVLDTGLTPIIHYGSLAGRLQESSLKAELLFPDGLSWTYADIAKGWRSETPIRTANSSEANSVVLWEEIERTNALIASTDGQVFVALEGSDYSCILANGEIIASAFGQTISELDHSVESYVRRVIESLDHRPTHTSDNLWCITSAWLAAARTWSGKSETISTDVPPKSWTVLS
jgi:hypothetical protein